MILDSKELIEKLKEWIPEEEYNRAPNDNWAVSVFMTIDECEGLTTCKDCMHNIWHHGICPMKDHKDNDFCSKGERYYESYKDY